MAIYRNCLCVELNKLKSPLKCRQALHRHPLVNTAGVVLSAVTAVTDSKAPTLLVLLHHACFCFTSVMQFFCRVYGA